MAWEGAKSPCDPMRMFCRRSEAQRSPDAKWYTAPLISYRRRAGGWTGRSARTGRSASHFFKGKLLVLTEVFSCKAVGFL